jgi:hypothetical protein
VFTLKYWEIFIEKGLKWREILLVRNLALNEVSQVHQMVQDSFLAHLYLAVGDNAVRIGVDEIFYQMLNLVWQSK